MLSPIAAWIAIRGTIELPPVLLAAVIFFWWVGSTSCMRRRMPTLIDSVGSPVSRPAWGFHGTERWHFDLLLHFDGYIS